MRHSQLCPYLLCRRGRTGCAPHRDTAYLLIEVSPAVDVALCNTMLHPAPVSGSPTLLRKGIPSPSITAGGATTAVVSNASASPDHIVRGSQHFSPNGAVRTTPPLASEVPDGETSSSGNTTSWVYQKAQGDKDPRVDTTSGAKQDPPPASTPNTELSAAAVAATAATAGAGERGVAVRNGADVAVATAGPALPLATEVGPSAAAAETVSAGDSVYLHLPERVDATDAADAAEGAVEETGAGGEGERLLQLAGRALARLYDTHDKFFSADKDEKEVPAE